MFRLIEALRPLSAQARRLSGKAPMFVILSGRDTLHYLPAYMEVVLIQQTPCVKVERLL